MKVCNGRALTQKEKDYLKEHDPETYEKARSLERQKNAYESALKRCRTKEEVQRLKLAHLGASLPVVNTVKHNPNISKAKKLEILMTENGKVANIEKATREFVRRGEYERLPDEQESLTEGAPGLNRPLELLLRPDLARARPGAPGADPRSAAPGGVRKPMEGSGRAGGGGAGDPPAVQNPQKIGDQGLTTQGSRAAEGVPQPGYPCPSRRRLSGPPAGSPRCAPWPGLPA